jgi:hypothetical protein
MCRTRTERSKLNSGAGSESLSKFGAGRRDSKRSKTERGMRIAECQSVPSDVGLEAAGALPAFPEE